MDIFLRVFGFVAMAVLGYASIFMVLILGMHLGVTASLPDDHLGTFSFGFFGGSVWACILGTLLGLGTFFIGGRAARALFFLPLVLPLVYALCALAYFAL